MSLIPYLGGFERPWSLMERELLRPNEFFGVSPYNKLMHRDTWDSTPWQNLEELSEVMTRLAFNELGSKITAADEDAEKFQVNVDVQHFSPEEITVKVVDGYVVVKGKHEEKADQHGYVSRGFVRRYQLPAGCLPDAVESKLSSDGVLTVTAPKVLPLPSIGERIVPVTHTGPVSKKRQDQN